MTTTVTNSGYAVGDIVAIGVCEYRVLEVVSGYPSVVEALMPGVVHRGPWAGIDWRLVKRAEPPAAASTQALREAAERALHALDEAAESLHTVSVCNHGSEEWPEGDWSELRAWAANRALVAREALKAVRSALAAETSGRDGGGNG